MSPERIDGREYSYPSDVWAFGLSLMTLALGALPIETQGMSPPTTLLSPLYNMHCLFACMLSASFSYVYISLMSL